jgi:hypothetical protein
VESPTKNAHANFVVETLEGDIVVITETTLPSDDSESLDRDVQPDKCGGTPPNNYLMSAIVIYPCISSGLI